MFEFRGASALFLAAGLVFLAEVITGLTIWLVSRLPGVRPTLLPRIWRIYWVGVGVGVVAVAGILSVAITWPSGP